MKKWLLAYLEIFKIIGIASVTSAVLIVLTCGVYFLLYFIFGNEWIPLLIMLFIAITLAAKGLKD